MEARKLPEGAGCVDILFCIAGVWGLSSLSFLLFSYEILGSKKSL